MIRKLLVANRGEIAARIMRTCREMGIGTVAIYADPDRDAPFVRAADEAIYIGPPMASASFLAIDRIVELARGIGADAIHPGYGFLAENADFAEACAAAGVIFVGPRPEAIRAMGNKTRAKELARSADVPVIPGFSADGLGDAEIAAAATELGLPVLLKAAAGGGGKGMRIVRAATELEAALAAGRREAKAAFGDESLLVERYIDNPRHVEVQILGDQHGNRVHCFERECSIQRRYQKIIEEAPSPAVDETLRDRMTSAALRLADRIDYSSAGTVEFVLDPKGDFYFLEVNTRLQVEHPVTEAITGLDLVRLQIEIAEGCELEVRQADIGIRGHAIECRVCAEDPGNEFLPSTGRIVVWEPSTAPGIRCDGGVVSGSEITVHYDSLIAKVIAHAPTRAGAVRCLAHALGETRLHGPTSNLEFLRRVLEHEEFAAGQIDTHFIARHPELCSDADGQGRADRLHAIAAALWLQDRRRAAAPVWRGLPSGWRNNPSQPQSIELSGASGTLSIAYQMASPTRARVLLEEAVHDVIIVRCGPDGIAVEYESGQRYCRIAATGDCLYVHSALGSSTLYEQPRFPDSAEQAAAGGCQAPMPGKILLLPVRVGDTVERGQRLVVIEAMKMEHDLVAPHDGIVREVLVEIGQQVNTGDVLVVLEEPARGEEHG